MILDEIKFPTLKMWLKTYKFKNSPPNKRNIMQALATPKLADKKKIKNIYIESINKSENKGRLYHVDHVIPLKSKLVCGLHVHNNLRIIGQSANCKKSNKFRIE